MKGLVYIFLLVVVAALVGAGYWLLSENTKIDENIKMSCLSRLEVQAQRELMGDVEGLCTCAAGIRKTASLKEKQAAGRACMDKYSKPSLMARCEQIATEINNEGSQMDCECFYDGMMDLYADMFFSKQGLEGVPQETRIAVVRQSALNCMKIKESAQ